MNIDHFKLKKLNLSEVKTLVEWAKKEGWNPGPLDANVYYFTDPDGFYGYYHDETLIAGGAIISYNQAYGFMGLFIVHPEYRGNGLGRKLWWQRRDLLIKRLHKGATIGMDGVVAMQAFYKKGGFEIAFKDERYEKLGAKFEISGCISAIREEDFKAILAYDKNCFGFERETFLSHWLKLPENKNFKYVENSSLRGFCVVRKASVGYKIGPLFADNLAIAEDLYKACLNSVVGELLYIDIPMVNQAAVELVNKYQAKYVFECARMYYGKEPKAETKKVFGITTFELG